MKLHWQKLKINGKGYTDLKVQCPTAILGWQKSQLIELGVPSVGQSSMAATLMDRLRILKDLGAEKSEIHCTLIDSHQSTGSFQKYFEDLNRFGIPSSLKKIDFSAIDHVRVFPSKGEIWTKKIESKKLKVLIVEDSKPVQTILNQIFSKSSFCEVVGIASSVSQSLDLLYRLKPDVVSLDMNLEGGTGADFLRGAGFQNWTHLFPKPQCFIISDCSKEEGSKVLESLALGAISYIQKPSAANITSFSTEMTAMMEELSKAAEAPVFKPRKNEVFKMRPSDVGLIAIGSSTGGTEIVRDLIGGFPMNAPPIVVVQHMPPEFTTLFAQRIENQTGRPTIEITKKTVLEKGSAYIANGASHLIIESREGKMQAKTSDAEPVNRFRPSVSVLFQSIADSGLANETLAIMLTGMGKDGAKEMLKLKEAGAWTAAQSKETCAVYGMPRAAEELGAVQFSGSPKELIALMWK